MKFKNYLIIASLGLWIAACKNEPAEGVREIQTADGPNAGIVRNPMSAEGTLDTSKLARIVFEETEFDFGEVKEGTLIQHDFVFRNTGSVPLTIHNARSSCGCTVPEWPREQIPPGGTGAIKAKFNTDGRPDNQRKMIRVLSNTFPNETNVLLKGKVIPK